MERKSVLIVGVTGGMGCGQSSVADFFEKFGCKVIVADKVSHQILEKDRQVKNMIKKVFGQKVFLRNGGVNREILAELAFQDDSRIQRLNSIVHPKIVSQIIDRIEASRDSGKYRIVIVDAALIYEVQLEKMFDAVIVVSANLNYRIARIKERAGLTEKEITTRILKQIPIEEKVRWADFVIHNNSTMEQLKVKTRKVYNQLIKAHRNSYKK